MKEKKSLLLRAQENEMTLGMLKVYDPELLEFLDEHKEYLLYFSDSKKTFRPRHSPKWPMSSGDVYRLPDGFNPEPPKPEPRWVEYAVVFDSALGYQVVLEHGHRISLTAATNGYQVGGLYGGVQFEGQSPSDWYTDPLQYIDDDGFPCYIDNGLGKLRPAVPVRVRFWVES